MRTRCLQCSRLADVRSRRTFGAGGRSGRADVRAPSACTGGRAQSACAVAAGPRGCNPIPIPRLPPAGPENRARVRAPLAVSGRVSDRAAGKLALKVPVSKPENVGRGLDYSLLRRHDDMGIVRVSGFRRVGIRVPRAAPNILTLPSPAQPERKFGAALILLHHAE